MKRAFSFVAVGLILFWTAVSVFSYIRLKRPSEEVPGRVDDPEGAKRRIIGAPGHADFVLWGDSHARALVGLFDQLARPRKIGGQCFIVPTIPPLIGVWNSEQFAPQTQLQWNISVIEWIKSHDVPHVFIVSRWDHRVPSRFTERGPTAQNTYLLQDDRSGRTTPDDACRVWEEGFKRTLAALEGRRVYFLMQLPVQETDIRGARGVSEETYELQQFEINRVLRSGRWPQLSVIGPGDWFRNGYSVTGDEGGSYYADGNHVSSYGAKKLLAPVLEPIFARISR